MPTSNSNKKAWAVLSIVVLTSKITFCHGWTIPLKVSKPIINGQQNQFSTIRRKGRNRSSSSLCFAKLSEQQEEEISNKVESTTNEEITTATAMNNDNMAIAAETNDDLSSIIDRLFLGIEPTPEILAIMAIYFVEGALGLARLAQTFFLKDTLHLGPAELSALTGLFTLPWTIKPLYGFLSDGLPLFGYRRRSYLIICGVLGSLCYAALGSDFGGLYDSANVAATMATSATTADAVVSSSSIIADSAPVIAAAGTTAVATTTPPISLIQATIASFIISSGCIAFSDVVADGIVVQRTRDSNDPKVAGGLQSLCWGSASIGALISAYFSGSLLEIMGPKEVFAITALLPALVALIAFFIDEEPIRAAPVVNGSDDKVIEVEVNGKGINGVTNGDTNGNTNGNTNGIANGSSTNGLNGNTNGAAINGDLVLQSNEAETGIVPNSTEEQGVKQQVEALWKAIQVPSVWKPAIFLFLWQSTPTSDSAFLFFMTNDLGMGPEFLGRARLVTAAASLVGVWGYQKFLRTVSIRSILFWTSLASAPLGLIQLLLITHANRTLGIPDAAFVLGDDVVLGILGEFAFLPVLVLAARICPPGVEAVLFATLMSIFNGASTVGTELGALLTKYMGVTESDFGNLGLLTIICSVSSLYPLLFFGLLDDLGTESEADIESEKVLEVGADV